MNIASLYFSQLWQIHHSIFKKKKKHNFIFILALVLFMMNYREYLSVRIEKVTRVSVFK